MLGERDWCVGVCVRTRVHVCETLVAMAVVDPVFFLIAQND